jgi:hypothetical protein
VARVVNVLDDLFGLPVTSGAVDVLEGSQCAPGVSSLLIIRHITVVSSANLMILVGGVCCNAVMGEQVQEGAEQAPLWDPCVEDQ